VYIIAKWYILLTFGIVYDYMYGIVLYIWYNILVYCTKKNLATLVFFETKSGTFERLAVSHKYYVQGVIRKYGRWSFYCVECRPTEQDGYFGKRAVFEPKFRIKVDRARVEAQLFHLCSKALAQSQLKPDLYSNFLSPKNSKPEVCSPSPTRAENNQARLTLNSENL
jgi:hypothetical protein